jgi:hypothetical protein
MAYWTDEGRCSECDRRGCVCPPGQGMNRAAGLDFKNVQDIVRSRSFHVKAYVSEGGYSVACNECGWHFTDTIPDTLAGETPHMGELTTANYILNVFNAHRCGDAKMTLETPSYICGLRIGCQGSTRHSTVCWEIANRFWCNKCRTPSNAVGNGPCACEKRHVDSFTPSLRQQKIDAVFPMLRDAHPDHEFRFEYRADAAAYDLKMRCRKCGVSAGKRVDEMDFEVHVNPALMLAASFELMVMSCWCHRRADIEAAMTLLNTIVKKIVQAWAESVGYDDTNRRYAMMEMD